MGTLAEFVREGNLDGLRTRWHTLSGDVAEGRGASLMDYLSTARVPELHAQRQRYDGAIREMDEFNSVCKPMLKAARVRRFVQLLNRGAHE